MDFVKTYDSEMDDDSDIEEIKLSPAKPPKEVDIIDLDSDSADESMVQSSKTPPNNKSKEKPSVSSNQEIDCIDLDLSDSTETDSPIKRIPDVPPQAPSNVSPQAPSNIPLQIPLNVLPQVSSNISPHVSSNVSPEVSSNISPQVLSSASPLVSSSVPLDASSNSEKKIDYLNLEDSESDIEIDTDDHNLTTLMETASVLDETLCGPQKPTDNFLNIVTENISLGKQLDKTLVSNLRIDSNCNSSRNTPDYIRSSISRDSIDTSFMESCSKDSTDTFSIVENNNIPDNFSDCSSDKNLSCIFRDDNQVIEAGQKNSVCRIPRRIIQTHNAHTNLITSLNWCIPKFSYLFLSASHDGSIKIWDLYRANSVQCIKVNSRLNAAKWSLDGGQIMTGGLDKKASVYDVQTGKKFAEYNIYNIVTSIEIHPYMEDVFLCGTKNAILGFDIRVDTTFPIRAYFSQCEEVLDIVFLDENEFICSTNIVSQDSADRTIMAWDFASGAILSNQIYLERFTCPSLKVHPSDSSFIAQTNGNYIAAFSTTRPYKMKDKKYTGHKVSGYGIECDISPDGKYAVSGDVEGSLYFYNYSTTNSVLVTPKQTMPTNRVKWHPVFPSTLISSSYDGQIHIWK